MPNWCENNLEVRAKTREKLEKFRREISTKWPREKKLALEMNGEIPKVIDEEKIEPIPESVDDLNSWRSAHWGSKWGCCQTRLTNESEKHMHYCFTSAWGPTLRLTRKMADMYPGMEFIHRYYEPGMALAGVAHFHNGEELEDKVMPEDYVTRLQNNTPETESVDILDDEFMEVQTMIK